MEVIPDTSHIYLNLHSALTQPDTVDTRLAKVNKEGFKWTLLLGNALTDRGL